MRHWSRSSSGRLIINPQSLSLSVIMAYNQNENPVEKDENLIDRVENESQHGGLNHPRTLRDYMNPLGQDHHHALSSFKMQHISISSQVSSNFSYILRSRIRKSLSTLKGI